MKKGKTSISELLAILSCSSLPFYICRKDEHCLGKSDQGFPSFTMVFTEIYDINTTLFYLISYYAILLSKFQPNSFQLSSTQNAITKLHDNSHTELISEHIRSCRCKHNSNAYCNVIISFNRNLRTKP